MTLSRAELRFYERLRTWTSRDDPLPFIWQVLNSHPAIIGPGPQWWLVPSATTSGKSYLLDLGARACSCDGFYYHHRCPHPAVADFAARLRAQWLYQER